MSGARVRVSYPRASRTWSARQCCRGSTPWTVDRRMQQQDSARARAGFVGRGGLRRPGCRQRARRVPLGAGRVAAACRGDRGACGQRRRLHLRWHRRRRAGCPRGADPDSRGSAVRNRGAKERVSTAKRTEALPEQVPHLRCADTLARAIGLVIALERGELDDLPILLQDRSARAVPRAARAGNRDAAQPLRRLWMPGRDDLRLGTDDAPVVPVAPKRQRSRSVPRPLAGGRRRCGRQRPARSPRAAFAPAGSKARTRGWPRPSADRSGPC